MAATDLDLDPNSAGGVHIAGLGALWQAVILGFASLDLKGDMLGVLGFSYGFRPGRGPHDALDALSVAITSRKVNYILDADVRDFLERAA